MGLLYEIFLAIGVYLMVLICSSVTTLGQEYARTGHMSLAVVDAIHSATNTHCPPPRRRQPASARN